MSTDISYRSILEYAEAEYVIERSRFIAHASPADTPEKARIFISEIREKYKDATHNVPAFVCGAGKEHQWASDDGEPSGTSGMPVLKLIMGRDLTNAAMVVTRYFGGIKLGTGGLSRAYTHVAGLALDRAGLCEVKQSVLMLYSMEYAFINKLLNLSSSGQFETGRITYTDVVTVEIKCPYADSEAVRKLIADMSAGQARLLDEKRQLAKYRLK